MMHYPPVTALANVIAQGSKLEQIKNNDFSIRWNRTFHCIGNR